MRVLSCVCSLKTKNLAAILTVFGRRMWNYFSTKKSNSAKTNGPAGGGQSASTLAIKWTYGKMDYGQRWWGPTQKFLF